MSVNIMCNIFLHGECLTVFYEEHFLNRNNFKTFSAFVSRLQNRDMKDIYCICLVVHLNVNSFDNLQNFPRKVSENEWLNMHTA
jgi:hypothetical protein